LFSVTRKSYEEILIFGSFGQIFSFAPVDSTGTNENLLSVLSVPLW